MILSNLSNYVVLIIRKMSWKMSRVTVRNCNCCLKDIVEEVKLKDLLFSLSICLFIRTLEYLIYLNYK